MENKRRQKFVVQSELFQSISTVSQITYLSTYKSNNTSRQIFNFNFFYVRFLYQVIVTFLNNVGRLFLPEMFKSLNGRLFIEIA